MFGKLIIKLQDGDVQTGTIVSIIHDPIEGKYKAQTRDLPEELPMIRNIIGRAKCYDLSEYDEIRALEIKLNKEKYRGYDYNIDVNITLKYKDHCSNCWVIEFEQ